MIVPFEEMNRLANDYFINNNYSAKTKLWEMLYLYASVSKDKNVDNTLRSEKIYVFKVECDIEYYNDLIMKVFGDIKNNKNEPYSIKYDYTKGTSFTTHMTNCLKHYRAEKKKEENKTVKKIIDPTINVYRQVDDEDYDKKKEVPLEAGKEDENYSRIFTVIPLIAELTNDFIASGQYNKCIPYIYSKMIINLSRDGSTYNPVITEKEQLLLKNLMGDFTNKMTTYSDGKPTKYSQLVFADLSKYAYDNNLVFKSKFDELKDISVYSFCDVSKGYFSKINEYYKELLRKSI